MAMVRLKEANVLLRLGLSDGAYYLAGYAVECALKACIAKGTRRYEFPDKRRVDSSYSHNFRDLVRVAGLDKARSEQATRDPEFERNWGVVEDWSDIAGIAGMIRNPRGHCSPQLATGGMGLFHG
jgi:HEPN domain-containing protein